jgi:hypothetical protein
LAARALLDDGVAVIIHSLADGIPSEIDFVEANWTHTKIAREYLRKAARNAA